MASRTGSEYLHTQKRRTMSKRLKDTTAVIYNYVKAKPLGSRSAREQNLFQQACSVTEHFSEVDRLALLRTTPATRRSSGPPEPSIKVLKDFEKLRESFLSQTRSQSPSPNPPSPNINPIDCLLSKEESDNEKNSMKEQVAPKELLEMLAEEQLVSEDLMGMINELNTSDTLPENDDQETHQKQNEDHEEEKDRNKTGKTLMEADQEMDKDLDVSSH